MGRPVSKKFFGPDAIRCKTIVDGSEVEGYLVKQTATREFIINVDGEEVRSKLVAKPAEDLAPGEMSVNVMNSVGQIVQVDGFKGRVLTTSTGEQASWNATGNSAFTIETVENPIEAATVVAPTSTANSSLGTQFRKPSTSYMLLGNTNPINKMQVATDGRIEVAVGPGFRGSSSGNPDSVSGTYTFQLLSKAVNASGNQIKEDWNLRFAFGLKQNPGNHKLTDLYDISIAFEKDGIAIGNFFLVNRNDTIVINSPYGTITDSYVSEKGDILQNIQRVSFIHPSYKEGLYKITATATPKDGTPAVVATFNVNALAPND
jgi:hypothetical protein